MAINTSQTRFATFRKKVLGFFREKFPHACRVKCCFKYHKYNYTLLGMKITSRILQFFFCCDYFENLLAAITFAKKILLSLAGVVSKNHFLRNGFGKSYLLRHLTITTALKNLILERGYTYYTNSEFLPRSTFYNFFPKVNSLETYCAYFVFRQVGIFSGK